MSKLWTLIDTVTELTFQAVHVSQDWANAQGFTEKPSVEDWPPEIVALKAAVDAAHQAVMAGVVSYSKTVKAAVTGLEKAKKDLIQTTEAVAALV